MTPRSWHSDCSAWTQPAPDPIPTPPHPNNGVYSCLRLVQAREPSQLQNQLQKTPKNVWRLPTGITFSKYLHTLVRTVPRLSPAYTPYLEDKTWEWWA